MYRIKVIMRIVAIIFLFLIISCYELPVTPKDLNYSGDYTLEIKEISGKEFNAFDKYRVSYTQGKDSYSEFKISSEPEGMIDGSLFEQTEDTFSLYFKNPFEGKICIAALKPNGVADTFKYDVSVKNPFSLKGQENVFVKDTARFSIVIQKNCHAIDNLKKVLWFRDTTCIDTTYPDEEAKIIIAKSGSFNIKAQCIDYLGSSIETQNKSLKATEEPVIKFNLDRDTLKVLRKNPGKVTVTGEAKKYVWKITGQKPETTSVSTIYLDSSWLGSQDNKLSVFGIDSFGYRGHEDSLIIIPVDYLYTLGFSVKPDSLIVKDTLKWSVNLFDNSGIPLIKKGFYNWTILNEKGDTIVDTGSTALSQFQTILNDSCLLKLMVTFSDSAGNEASPLNFSAPVKMYRPCVSVNIPAKPFYSFTPIEIPCELNEKYRKILMIYGTLVGNSSTLYDSIKIENTENISLSFLPTDTGLFKLKVWTKDSLGIVSDTSFSTIYVQDGQPIVSGITVPPVIYMNQSISLTTVARASVPGIQLNEYKWSFDGDTVWDTVTNVPNIKHLFKDDSAKIALQVKDGSGVSSSIFISTFPVDSGIPTVDSTDCGYQQLIDQPFSIHVFSHDNEGGKIDSFKITLKKGSSSYSFYSSNSNVEVNLSDTGIYEVLAQVRDTSGFWSKVLTDKEVKVTEGKPIVKNFTFSDTAWINDTIKFNIGVKTTYPGHLINKVFIFWGDSSSDSFSVSFSDGVINGIEHSFKKSGDYKISIVVEEENGLKSDSFSQIITVHEGKPVISACGTKFYYTGYDAYKDTFQTVSDNDTLIIPHLVPGMPFIVTKIKANAKDTNGTVKEYAFKLLPPFDTTGITWNTSNEFLINTSGIDLNALYPDSPAVKCVLYCKDDDNIVGSDTFFLKTDRSFNYDGRIDSVAIISPTLVDTVKNATFDVVWTGGNDKEDQLKTNVSITVYYNSGMYGYANNLTIKDTLGAFAFSEDTFKATIKLPEGDLNTGLFLIKTKITVWDRVRQSKSTEQTSNISIQQ